MLENELDIRESLKKSLHQPTGGKMNPLGQAIWRPIGIKQVVGQLFGTVWEEEEGGHLNIN